MTRSSGDVSTSAASPGDKVRSRLDPGISCARGTDEVVWTGSSETEVLRGFLDYLRNSISAKVEGAPEPGVRTAGVPSGTNLLGLLNHLTFVERAMFLGDRVTDWQATFHAAPADSVADVVARYRETVSQADEVLDRCTDLGVPVPRPRPGGRAPSVRWALTHMIEETGRHAGHADTLRELNDGATGR